MKPFTTCLWFNDQAEEAANFYLSVFKHGKIGKITRYPNVGFEIHGGRAGSVMTVEFEVNNQQFVALNGGPIFKFNESVSFVINCKDQVEVDHYWDQLIKDGGEASQCGWLKDKYGLSWQVTPEAVHQMLLDPDQKKVERVMGTLLQMQKLDLSKLEAAYNGKG